MELFEGKSQVVDELIRKEVAGENSVWFTKYGGFTKVVHTSYENVMKKLQKEYGPDIGVEVGRLPSTRFYTSISKSSSMLALLAFNRETSSDWWEPSYRASSELRRKRHCKSRGVLEIHY